MSYELLPCPFCGGAGKVFEERKCRDQGYFPKIGYIRCQQCGATSGDVITEGYYGATISLLGAVALWNKRTPYHDPEQTA